MSEWITVGEAAEILGVSVARVHQYIAEPCPDCGKVQYHSTDEETEVVFDYGKGCEWCDYGGRRLPTHGRFGKEHRYGYRLDRAQVEKLAKNRKPGYPKGKKRRK